MTKRNRDPKRKRTNKYTSAKNVKSEYTNMLQIVGLVSAIFIVFSIITILATKKTTASSNQETTIQYDYIMVGEILNQTPTEYYVLVTDKEDANELYQLYISYYEQKENYLNTYFVNLNDGFNSNYVSDTSNILVNDISKIRFKDATLLHVKNKEIDIYYEGKQQLVIQYDKLIK